MKYYKQKNRQTGEVIAFLTCSGQLKDEDEKIKLDELTEEEYTQGMLEIIATTQEEETDKEAST